MTFKSQGWAHRRHSVTARFPMLLYVPIIVRDPELLKSFLQSLTQDTCPHTLVFAEVFGSHQEPHASPLFNLILSPPPQPGPVHPPLNAKTFFQVESFPVLAKLVTVFFSTFSAISASLQKVSGISSAYSNFFS